MSTQQNPAQIIAAALVADQFGDLAAMSPADRAGWVLNAGAAVRALEAAGDAVVKLPAPTMEPRKYTDRVAPTWSATPEHGIPVRVWVYEADGEYIAEDHEGAYTADEVLARGACFVAAGFEAKRLQGGESR